MNNSVEVFPQALVTPLVPIFLVLASLALLLWINRHALYGRWCEFKTRRFLNRLGLEQLTGVRCPDGLGEHFTIDRLLLRHDGISLLMEKRYPGKIFCSEQIDEWTQMLGQKSYPFRNPLFELELQVKAVAACFPDIDIDGYLFFDHHATFPRGQPASVIRPDSIPKALERNHRHQVNPQVLNTWKAFASNRAQG